MEYKFPENFLWGTATSAAQIESCANNEGKGNNILDHWYDIDPDRFFDNVGPNNTCDFYNRYVEDIVLMKKLGHNSFRISIAWSRLFPNGHGKINNKAVKFYNEVLDTLHKNNIEPFVNLSHFDLPYELQRNGGWENKKTIDYYTDYAKTCFKLFGSKVKYWFTFNEPVVMAECGYIYNTFFPHVVDFKRAIQVGYNIIVAHANAINEFRQMNLKSKIGIVLNLSPVYPRSSNKGDEKAAKYLDLFLNKAFIDPVIKGKYPKELIKLFYEKSVLPKFNKKELKLIKSNKIDILGINYYQPRRAKIRENAVNLDAPFMPEHMYDTYSMPHCRMNKHRGWEIYPKGIYDILIDIKENYGNIESFISENGMGVEGEDKFKKNNEIQDDYRISFIKDHLKYLHKALNQDCNVKGYHLWTFMDNWSWANAFKNRYGLVEINRNNNLERVVKKSGWWFKNLIENSGF